jgi:hypothetical protein
LASVPNLSGLAGANLSNLPNQGALDALQSMAGANTASPPAPWAGVPSDVPVPNGGFGVFLRGGNGSAPGADQAVNGVIPPQPASQPTTDPAAASAAPSQPSPGDINSLITQLLGAAPTLGDFYSSAPYDQANSQLQQGVKGAAGSIDSAYGNAKQSQAQNDAQSLAALAQITQQANDRSNILAQAQNQTVGQALNAAGANSQLGARLGEDQAIFNQDNSRAGNVLAELTALAQSNAQSSANGLAASQAGNQAALQAAASGEAGKIGLAQANAQTAGQRAFASANAARANNFDSLLGRANSYLQGMSGTGRTQANATLSDWQAQGHTGALTAFQSIMNSTDPNSGQPVQGLAKPSNAAEALQSLQNMVQSGLYGKIAPNISPQEMATVISNYYDNRRQPVSVADLQAFLQAGLPMQTANGTAA